MHCLLNGGAFFKLSDSALTKFAKSVASLNPLVRAQILLECIPSVRMGACACRDLTLKFCVQERGRALLQAQGLRKLSDDTASTEAASTECPEVGWRML